jgi:hypothetical protein
MDQLGFWLIGSRSDDELSFLTSSAVIFEGKDFFYYAGGLCSHGWCPKDDGGRVTFEEFLDQCSEEDKDVILFNLDLFIC